METKITPKGFQQLVAMSLTGEAGEHVVDIRPGSALELADQVAKRCTKLCAERDIVMSDQVYREVVAVMAPHFLPSL